MKERMAISIGLVVLVAAIYFGYMVYQRKGGSLTVLNGGAGDDVPAADNAGA
jgi:hypothetical protein